MMKTGILFLSVMLLSFGCDNDGDLSKDDNAANTETPPVYPVEIQATDFSLPEGCGWRFYFPTDLSPHRAFYIINSQDDLKDKLYCEDNVPVMDFDKYSLLVFICDYGENLTHQLQQIDEYRYKWNIDIKGTTRSGFLSIAILIPKLPQNAIVDLDIIDVNSAIKGQWICSPDGNVIVSLSFNLSEGKLLINKTPESSDFHYLFATGLTDYYIRDNNLYIKYEGEADYSSNAFWHILFLTADSMKLSYGGFYPSIGGIVTEYIFIKQNN